MSVQASTPLSMVATSESGLFEAQGNLNRNLASHPTMRNMSRTQGKRKRAFELSSAESKNRTQTKPESPLPDKIRGKSGAWFVPD